MPVPPTYIASDVHLGATSQFMERAFVAWLEFIAADAELVLINGDLFDFWFEWGTVVPRGHTRVLAALGRIVDADIPVHLMGGNHDWWGGRYLTDEVGLVFHTDPVRLTLAGRSSLVAHGDGLGDGDLGYRVLKRVLRSPVSRWAFRWLHPDLATGIARRVSRTHVNHGNGGPEAAEAGSLRAEALERWARDRLLEEDDLGLVVLGHSHLPRCVEVAPDRFYVNAGDWLTHGTYIRMEPGEAPVLSAWDCGSQRPIPTGTEKLSSAPPKRPGPTPSASGSG